MNIYEAMFVIEPTIAAKEWDKAVAELERLFKKHQITLITLDKWGERRLTYPIRKQTRGTYALVYFKAGPQVISALKVDCELSEVILRFLFLRHEGEVKKVAIPAGFATPAQPTEEELIPPLEVASVLER